jgi:hypothetical protein
MTTPKTSASSSSVSSEEIATVDQSKLLSSLELVDRYGEDFSYAELSAIAAELSLALRELLAQDFDEKTTTALKVAQRELQPVLDPTRPFATGVIVVILLIGRSALIRARR